VRVIGAFDDRSDQRSPASIAGVPNLGSIDDLVEFARHTRVDLVIFSLPISAESRILQMLKKLWVLPVDIRLSAHTNKLRYRPRSYSYVGNVPVLDIFDKPIADWNMLMKTLFDRVAGLMILILLSPLMLATAIAVKLGHEGIEERVVGILGEVFRELQRSNAERLVEASWAPRMWRPNRPNRPES